MAIDCSPACLLEVLFPKRRTKGYVSLLVLLLLSAFSAWGMEVYLKATIEKRMVRREVQSLQALYVAEGGIEWAKVHLQSDYGLSQGEVLFDTGQARISIHRLDGGYRVTSEGHSGLAVRKVEEILQKETGKWIIQSYQELHQ